MLADNEEIERFNLPDGTPLPIVGEQIETESGQYTVTGVTHHYREFEDEINEPKIHVHAEPDSDDNSAT